MTRLQFITTLSKHKQMLPLLLLAAYCIDAIVTAINGKVTIADTIYDYQLSAQHFLAFGAVALNFIAYFFLRNIYKYILVTTIAVGLFNLIVFSALHTTNSYSTCLLPGVKVSFQPSAFYAGMVCYILNFKRANRYIISQLTTKRTPEEIERNQKEQLAEEVQKFKDRYEGFSIEDLTKIVSEAKLVPGAVEAARQLLNERKTI